MNKPTISINAENIQNTQSLNITLTISTNDGRIASATNSFTIVYNVTAPKGLTIL